MVGSNCSRALYSVLVVLGAKMTSMPVTVRYLIWRLRAGPGFSDECAPRWWTRFLAEPGERISPESTGHGVLIGSPRWTFLRTRPCGPHHGGLICRSGCWMPNTIQSSELSQLSYTSNSGGLKNLNFSVKIWILAKKVKEMKICVLWATRF